MFSEEELRIKLNSRRILEAIVEGQDSKHNYSLPEKNIPQTIYPRQISRVVRPTIKRYRPTQD